MAKEGGQRNKTSPGPIGRVFVSAKKTTGEVLNPQKGERKLRLTLLLSLLFIALCVGAIFFFKENIVEMLKILQSFIQWVLGIFVVGNSAEHVSEAIVKNNKGGNDGPFIP